MRKLLRQEDGMALVLALVVMLVLTSGAATAYFYAQANLGQATASKGHENSYHAAEAGLADAIAVVQNPNNNDQSTTLFGTTAGQLTTVCIDPNVAAVNGACPAGQRTWATYTGSLDTSGAASIWNLKSIGYAFNPSGGNAGPLMHTVTAQIQLQAENDTSNVDDSWSYLFSTQPKSSGTTCDQTYTTNISTFVYAAGNLCLSGTGGEFTDTSSHNTKIEANGYIELTNSTYSYVGTSSNTAVGTVKTNLGCIYSSTTYAPCSTGSNHQFIKSSSGTSDGVTPPVVNWDAWYRASAPGPLANCQSAGNKSTASTTWPVFDNDTTRNDSLDNPVSPQVGVLDNLTPNYAYKCWTNNGHIYWDPSKDQLSIGGTVFIDGSAYIANGVNNTYQGYGTIYLSGTFYLGTNTKMCAYVVSSGNCNTFYSLFSFFVIATNGHGLNNLSNSVPSGDGIELGSGSTFQGWLYATANIHAESTTTIMGPMIGNQLQLNSNVSSWQSTWNNQGPSGAPGNDPQNNDTNQPTNFTG